ncbi:ABC transporter ATP-binding protein [Flavicella sp.]|uniref:ABC transporter ATP-binding protein n=1 Tax=Flavicella sp. TaxID=2957742 RepID=UPI003019AD3B
MSDVILKVENLSKQYRLGTIGTGTISHDLNRWWAGIRGKEDPYLKIGETNDRSKKGESEYVWALKDINFEVKRGEILGIIGKNGAGKSTLLKILSKVTGPTTGVIKYNGRIASLLEVGTGFHPEMTGKENVFLNGAILGMTKKEISSKLDEIIEFSGCERFIDTPVKRYSSGMKVRLAFAVAAFLEPDILVVDEVLAVGDTEFQKKAIGKMQDISNTEGRTVLFVSHDMAAISSLCSICILLEYGYVKEVGETKQVINNYLTCKTNTLLSNVFFKDDLYLKSFKLLSKQRERIDFVLFDSTIIFEVEIESKREIVNDFILEFKVKSDSERVLSTFSTYLNKYQFKTNGGYSRKLSCVVDSVSLIPGKYSIDIIIIKYMEGDKLAKLSDVYNFEVVRSNNFIFSNKIKSKFHGDFIMKYKWS